MLSWLIKDIVCQTFQYELEKGQLIGLDGKSKVMIIGVRTSTPKDAKLCYGEDPFYRHLDLLLWAPTNYKQVWIRRRDTPALEGFVPVSTPWELKCDHDSAWREAVGDFFFNNEHEMLGFNGEKLFQWYSIIGVPKEIREAYERGSRRAGD